MPQKGASIDPPRQEIIDQRILDIAELESDGVERFAGPGHAHSTTSRATELHRARGSALR
jgi:hypothetical protein